MQKLSRREALRGTGVAALAAGLMVPVVLGAEQHGVSAGKLAELIRLYRQGVQAFNANGGRGGRGGRQRLRQVERPTS